MPVNIRNIIDRLGAGQLLGTDELSALITVPDGEGGRLIAEGARALTDRIHGRRVLVRGLLEIGNICRNNCLYCGIRASNSRVSRYSLDEDTIVDSCRDAYAIGFRTFVLQGGEWPAADDMVTRAVSRIHGEMPDCAITLSLGERPREVYAEWRRAGASRYLLRHETADATHYASLHPAGMSLEARLHCLDLLLDLGYQVGAGMMIGSPRQTVDTLCADLDMLQRLRPQMVGMGPFIPHSDTPLADCPAGSVGLSTRLISIVRLMLPHANIPSTTALATVDPRGRVAGLLAGANVVMPNISPCRHRRDYQLYDNKAAFGAESAEGLDALARSLEPHGLTLDMSRGDFHTDLT